AAMQAFGVEFLETPREEPYGTVAVFRDLYGTQLDLLEPKQ
ncbi:glyoxalase, partial [Xanthomonas oryzae pv. oryzae]